MVFSQYLEDYPIDDMELIGQMVQRLRCQVKDLYAQIEHGQIWAAAIETLIREQLWQFGHQELAVLLELLDQQLTAGLAVHDRRTRTIMTL